MKDQHYNIFLSYRRNPGRDFARTLKQAFEYRGWSVFFDYNSLRDGKFNEEIFTAIENCDVFVLSYSEGSLDRCRNEDDWVRIEIEHAIKHGKKIIPVAQTELYNHLSFPKDLPLSLAVLTNIQTTEIHSGNYFDHSIDDCIKDRFPKGLVREGRVQSERDMKEAERLFREGRQHEDGLEGPCDIEKAFECYRAAAEKGHPDAQFEVGTAYNEGWGGRVWDMDSAVEWWTKAAEGGSPDAQFALAGFYEKGLSGFAKDISRASDLYGQAFRTWKQRADAGDARAQRSLAECCYLDGKGTDPDPRLALVWLRKAAENNDVWAMLSLGTGVCIGVDEDERKMWSEKAFSAALVRAKNGNPWYQATVANFYAGCQGDGAVEPDEKEACRWYGKAAEQGVRWVQRELGLRHLKGAGVPVDYRKSYKLLFAAAVQGDKEASFAFGMCLLLRLGNEADREDSLQYFEKAAEGYDSNGCADFEEDAHGILTLLKESGSRSGENVAFALAKGHGWRRLADRQEECGWPDEAVRSLKRLSETIRSAIRFGCSFVGEDGILAAELLAGAASSLSKKGEREEALSIRQIELDLLGDRTDKEALSLKVDALKELAVHHHHEKEYQQAAQRSRAALDSLRSLESDSAEAPKESREAELLYLLGSSLFRLGRFDEAVDVLRKSNDLYWKDSSAASRNTEQALLVSHLLAQCHYRLGNNAMAYFQATRTIERFRRVASGASSCKAALDECKDLLDRVRPFNQREIDRVPRSLKGGDGGFRLAVKFGWCDEYRFCDLVAFDDCFNFPLLLLPEEGVFQPARARNPEKDVRTTEDCTRGTVVYPELLVRLAEKSLDSFYPDRKERNLRRRCLIVCGTATMEAIERNWNGWLSSVDESDVRFCSYPDLEKELLRCFNYERSDGSAGKEMFEVWVDRIPAMSFGKRGNFIFGVATPELGRWGAFLQWFRCGKRLFDYEEFFGAILFSGLKPEVAVSLWKRLVRNGAIASARPTGNAAVQNHIGWIYAVCRGVPADYAEAVKWFRLAAEQGHADAQKNLGRMYEIGHGVSRDEAEAVKWFRKAAAQGVEDAQDALRQLGVSQSSPNQENRSRNLP